MRHSRGFGVHSPLAYGLVKDVLRPPRCYSYYAEEEFGRQADSARQLKRLRMMVRLLARTAPATVRVSPALPPLFARTAAGVCPAAAVSGTEADPEVAVASGIANDELPAIMQLAALPHRTILIFDCSAELISRLAATFTGGAMLAGPRSALIVTRPGMPRMVYDVAPF